MLTLDEFRAKLDSGWITVTPVDGAPVSTFELATWDFANSDAWLTPDGLFAEVRNEMDRLAGRPTAEDRCDAAVDAFVREPTEENRAALLAAYLAVPEHERMFLGDMDVKDWPYRALATPLGGTLADGGDPVTAEDHAGALEYFADRGRMTGELDARRHSDGPAETSDPTVVLDTIYGQWPAPPSVHVLRAEYPAAVEVGGHTYPTLGRAYWALAAADPAVRDAIREADGTGGPGNCCPPASSARAGRPRARRCWPNCTGPGCASTRSCWTCCWRRGTPGSCTGGATRRSSTPATGWAGSSNRSVRSSPPPAPACSDRGGAQATVMVRSIPWALWLPTGHQISYVPARRVTVIRCSAPPGRIDVVCSLTPGPLMASACVT